MGFFSAMRVAYRQINYRDDLRYLPTLLTRTHSFWPVVLLCAAGVVIVMVDNNSTDFWFGMAGLVLPPYPLVPAMLAGVLAPRAAWLAGALSGVVSGLGIWAIIGLGADRFPLLQNLSVGERMGIAVEWMFVAVCFGALVGSLSAWYRRFLNLVMVPRPQRSQSRGKPVRGAKRPVTR